MIYRGSRRASIRITAPAHSSLLVLTVVSMLSQLLPDDVKQQSVSSALDILTQYTSTFSSDEKGALTHPNR